MEQTIKNGSKVSHSTIKAQAALRRLGFYPFPSIVDGIFDEELEQSIFRFQKAKALAVDGIIGPITWGAINKELKDVDHLFHFLHCVACQPLPHHTGESISRYFRKRLGWSREGYGWVFNLDGTMWTGLENYDKNVGTLDYTFGTRVFNYSASHSSYIGGVIKQNGKLIPYDTRTAEQKKSIETFVKFLLLRIPDIVFAPHYSVQRKACPSYNASAWLREIGVPIENIAQWGRVYS